MTRDDDLDAESAGDFESTEIGRVPVVGVGASAGGLEAFRQLLAALPTDTGMAFVLVSHLAPEHASAMSTILQRATAMPVVEATSAIAAEPDHVYVIPPGRNLSISDGILELTPRDSAVHPPLSTISSNPWRTIYARTRSVSCCLEPQATARKDSNRSKP